jgi:hypothetical protein
LTQSDVGRAGQRFFVAVDGGSFGRGLDPVAMASTLAGNLTLVGSVANLIVVQRARAHGVEVNFWVYFRVGAMLTVLTILFGILWL